MYKRGKIINMFLKKYYTSISKQIEKIANPDDVMLSFSIISIYLIEIFLFRHISS